MTDASPLMFYYSFPNDLIMKNNIKISGFIILPRHFIRSFLEFLIHVQSNLRSERTPPVGGKRSDFTGELAGCTWFAMDHP